MANRKVSSAEDEREAVLNDLRKELARKAGRRFREAMEAESWHRGVLR